MKRAVLFLAVFGMLMIPREVKASEVETHTAWATAYCTSGTTSSGTQTVPNLTVASKPEWRGLTMCMWEDDGSGKIKPENFLGIYVVEDTGGETIKNGSVIDVFIPVYDDAIEFGSRRVIFTLTDAEG